MLDIVARLSCGREMPDGTIPAPRLALIIAEEDRQSTLKARLLVAGADFTRVRLVASVGSDAAFFTLPNHVQVLREAIEEMGAGFRSH